MRFHRRRVRLGTRPQLDRDRVIPARVGVNGKGTQRRDQKPAEPYTLAAPLNADAIHPVVPIAGADERYAMRSRRAGFAQRAQGMLVDRAAFVTHFWQVIHFVLMRFERAHR